MSEPIFNPDEPFIVPQEGQFWGFAYLRPRTEKKFAQKLTDFGIRSYLPLMKKMRVHNRGKVVTWVPMFTSYVFLEIPNTLYTNIVRYPEVLTLDLCEQPEIQEGLVADLNRVRKCELLAENHKVVVNPGIQPGMTVLVKKGALAGTEAIVLRRENEVRVVVNLYILGRHCDCTLNADDLQEIL